MRRPSLYVLAIAVAIVVASLHFLAVEDSLYWIYRWFDIPMHLLGGLMIGIPAAVILCDHGWRRTRLFLGVVAVALCVGLVWEVFEFKEGLTAFGPGFALDTTKDLINDTLGAIGGLLFIKKVYVRS